MKVILPWAASPKNTDITSINLWSYTYITTNKIGVGHMTHEGIILRLESAIYDKDWAAVELLLEDLRILVDEDGWGTITWEEEEN